MAASALVVEEIVKYFPFPQTGVRAFLNPFAPLTHPALLGVSFQVGAGEVAGLRFYAYTGSTARHHPL
jgi:hypothetical protein